MEQVPGFFKDDPLIVCSEVTPLVDAVMGDGIAMIKQLLVVSTISPDQKPHQVSSSKRLEVAH